VFHSPKHRSLRPLAKVAVCTVFNLISPCVLSQSTDFFPLGIEHRWIYSYKATEDQYDGFFLMNQTNDSGTVQYVVQDTLRSDTGLVWIIEERDTILRHIIDYFSESDTVFSIGTQSTFQLVEAMDSAHTLVAQANFPPFTFPVRWFSTIGSAITRYAIGSSYLDKVESYFVYPLMLRDSLRFAQDVGLVWAQSSIDKGPSTLYHKSWQASLVSFTTGMPHAVASIPELFLFVQNYPNPFNSSTTILFHLPQRTFVTLTIYDILGRTVERLVEEPMDPGTHRVSWSDPNLGSGLYFCMLKTDGYLRTIKLVMAK